MENLGAMAYSRYTGFREITDRNVLELHCICYKFPYILRSEIIFTSKLRPINGMFNNTGMVLLDTIIVSPSKLRLWGWGWGWVGVLFSCWPSICTSVHP